MRTRTPGGAAAGSGGARSPGSDQRHMGAALALIAGLMAAEIIAGLAAHSLALLSDAGHMLTDAGALALSLGAIRLAKRPPKGGMTYGLKRAEILSALINGALLAVLATSFVYAGILRLMKPPRVEARTVLAVALAGMVVNLAATWQVGKANLKSLNVQGSMKHLLTDLYAFVGTALAALVILITGFNQADAIATMLVAALMLASSYQLLRDAGRVLLEGAPAEMDPAEVRRLLGDHPCVTNVHDLHVWEITSGFPAMSAHVLVRPADDCHEVRLELEDLLENKFGISHTTIQVDHDEQARLLSIEKRPGPAGA